MSWEVFVGRKGLKARTARQQFTRFEDLTRKLLAVPKSEVDALDAGRKRSLKEKI